MDGKFHNYASYDHEIFTMDCHEDSAFRIRVNCLAFLWLHIKLQCIASKFLIFQMPRVKTLQHIKNTVHTQFCSRTTFFGLGTRTMSQKWPHPQWINIRPEWHVARIQQNVTISGQCRHRLKRGEGNEATIFQQTAANLWTGHTQPQIVYFYRKTVWQVKTQDEVITRPPAMTPLKLRGFYSPNLESKSSSSSQLCPLPSHPISLHTLLPYHLSPFFFTIFPFPSPPPFSGHQTICGAFQAETSFLVTAIYINS